MIFTKATPAERLKKKVKQAATSMGHKTEDAASYVAHRAEDAASFVGHKAEDLGQNIAKLRHDPAALAIACACVGFLVARATTRRR